MDYPNPIDRMKGRSRSYPWVFRIDKDAIFQSQILGREFESRWLRLEKNGQITVKANETGYAWDGCTPKVSLFGLVIIGIPDGHIDVETLKPKTHNASLVHDAFYQYLEHVPVHKSEIDRLFYQMLKETAFPLARLYYIAVVVFGGRGVKQKNI